MANICWFRWSDISHHESGMLGNNPMVVMAGVLRTAWGEKPHNPVISRHLLKTLMQQSSSESWSDCDKCILLLKGRSCNVYPHRGVGKEMARIFGYSFKYSIIEYFLPRLLHTSIFSLPHLEYLASIILGYGYLLTGTYPGGCSSGPSTVGTCLESLPLCLPTW